MAEYAQPATGCAQQESYAATAYQRLSHHHHPHTITSCAFIFSTLMALIVTSIFVVLFILLIIFRLQLPDFSVTHATISFSNSSGNQLTANWDVNVTIFNGNKHLGVNYQYVTAAIGNKDDPLANTSLPPLYQRKQNTTTISFHIVIHFGSKSMKVSESKASQLKTKSAPSDGMAYFDMQLQSAMQ
ncbi:uncharacterized protein LOC116259027 [Nymphaea colorata]|nr:uncharacterized protein LOC116259027 [Nymphaea colorata]